MIDKAVIRIPKKQHLKGEDGYKIFSVRIRNETANALEELSVRSNRSRNELIGMILEYAVNHKDITEKIAPINFKGATQILQLDFNSSGCESEQGFFLPSRQTHHFPHYSRALLEHSPITRRTPQNRRQFSPEQVSLLRL